MIEDEMIILAIETSCDDTCVSVVKDFNILSNVVSSQIKIHRKYGGVFPALAKREHQNNLVPVLRKALKEAKLLKAAAQELNKKEKLKEILTREPVLAKKLISFLKKYQKPKVDALAVTIGPGLEPCLWAGINFTKALSYYWNLPIIPINHIEAHIFINLINKIEFPAIALVVSGGHTQLILIKAWGKYKILGETRDDAAGECFDKTARILGLSYPGGPEIAKMADKAKEQKIKLPRPMIHSKDYDFSFSGLKTAVLYRVKSDQKKTKEYIQEMCAEIQQSIIDVLIHKTMQAAKEYKAKTVVLGGGVTANKELKKQFREKIKETQLEFRAPEAKFSTDNAAMVGITACQLQPKRKTKAWRSLEADANLKIN